MFKNRQEAGRLLAKALQNYKQKEGVLVLALPRGGVPVAYEVAQELKLPLDILIVRKIGSPMNPEYALGALSEKGVVVWNERERGFIQRHWEDVEETVEREEVKIRTYQKKFRKKRSMPRLKNKTVILIDDGLATGLTMEAAILTCQREKAKKIVVVVPVAALDSVQRIQKSGVKLVGLKITPFFSAVAQFYEDFEEVTDEKVERLLKF